MPLAMISNTVVRSASVEQHEDSDRVEKFVRYVAKCNYKVSQRVTLMNLMYLIYGTYCNTIFQMLQSLCLSRMSTVLSLF